MNKQTIVKHQGFGLRYNNFNKKFSSKEKAKKYISKLRDKYKCVIRKVDNHYEVFGRKTLWYYFKKN